MSIWIWDGRCSAFYARNWRSFQSQLPSFWPVCLFFASTMRWPSPYSSDLSTCCPIWVPVSSLCRGLFTNFHPELFAGNRAYRSICHRHRATPINGTKGRLNEYRSEPPWHLDCPFCRVKNIRDDRAHYRTDYCRNPYDFIQGSHFPWFVDIHQRKGRIGIKVTDVQRKGILEKSNHCFHSDCFFITW